MLSTGDFEFYFSPVGNCVPVPAAGDKFATKLLFNGTPCGFVIAAISLNIWNL